MTKLALIQNNSRFSWQSCNSISSNLTKAYRHAFKDNIQYFSTDLHSVKKLKEYKPDVIIFTDHRPHPKDYVKEIFYSFRDDQIKDLPELVFHIYGDYIIDFENWFQMDKFLRNFKCKFICASKAQTKILKKIIHNHEETLFYCPFPVDSEEFHFDKALRDETREQLGLIDNQKALLYTGRLSYQKNILKLISVFKAVKTLSPFNTKLFIAGGFDNIGIPYLDKNLFEKEYAFKVSRMLDSLDENIRKDIVLLGSLNKGELKQVYNASDLFVSFSTYNDEDYGMSLAEALSTGLQSLTTDWGGYRTLNEISSLDQSDSLKVSIEGDKLNFNSNLALKKILMFENYNNETRLSNSLKVQKQLCPKNLINRIKGIIFEHSFSFKGYTSLADELSERIAEKAPFHFNQKYSSFYKEVYGGYFE